MEFELRIKVEDLGILKTVWDLEIQGFPVIRFRSGMEVDRVDTRGWYPSYPPM